MFGVVSSPAAGYHENTIVWENKCGFFDYIAHFFFPFWFQGLKIGCNTSLQELMIYIIHVKYFAGVHPNIIQSGLKSVMAFFGAIAKSKHPFTAMAQVIPYLLQRFCCQAG